MIEFLSVPPEKFIFTRLLPRGKQAVLEESILEYRQKGALEEVPPEEIGSGVYSPVFLVPKATGGWRMIIDLRYLNQFLKKRRFRMETIKSVISILNPGDLMVTLDLKDAYLHIPVCQAHRKYLRVAVSLRGTVKHFQFAALPFGITTAPYIFTKVVIAVVAPLRLRGLEIIPYLDDWLLKAHSAETLHLHLLQAQSFLQRLGWIINWQKSEISPSTTRRFLGFIIDSANMTLSLSPERKLRISKTAGQLMVPRQVTIRVLMRMLGLMSAAVDAVPWALWHIRPLQAEVLSLWDRTPGGLETKCSLSSQARRSLKWWKQVKDGRSLIQPSWILLTTDASLLGWGAHLEELQVQGSWSPQERLMSSNLRELRAIRMALFHFFPLIRNKAVRVRSDNSTAVSYINRQGGTRSQSLLSEVGLILSWAEQNLSHLSAVHIRGSLNVVADQLSRGVPALGEMSLNQEIFHQITLRWGRPDIDLMATRFNAKVETFCSLYREDNPLAVDALSIPWEFRLAYIFPPIAMIPRVLMKIRQDQASVIAVIPFWPRRSWFTLLMQMSRGQYWKLPPMQNLVSRGTQLCLDPSRLNLTAWRLMSPF